MAYPNFYQYYQPQQAPAPTPTQQQVQTSSGFVTVRNEEEARNYPVAFGNSVTFRDENAPYIYTKTMGFSQLDRPVFDKYKLVKEEARQDPKPPEASAEDIAKIKAELADIRKELDAIRDEVKEGA